MVQWHADSADTTDFRRFLFRLSRLFAKSEDFAKLVCLISLVFVSCKPDIVPESAKTDTKSLLCDTFCVVGRIDENGIFVNEWPGSYAEFTADSAFSIL